MRRIGRRHVRGEADVFEQLVVRRRQEQTRTLAGLAIALIDVGESAY